MARVTQADVIRAAIAQFKKRGGYTPNGYLVDGRGLETGPGDHVRACCAIGGVEQAIWKLTGENVIGLRLQVGQQDVPPPVYRRTLYGGVMRKLNAKARKLYPTLPGMDRKIETVEDVTFCGTKQTSKKRMLRVFEEVLADLS
jgi:hypothetical protein